MLVPRKRNACCYALFLNLVQVNYVSSSPWYNLFAPRPNQRKKENHSLLPPPTLPLASTTRFDRPLIPPTTQHPWKRRTACPDATRRRGGRCVAGIQPAAHLLRRYSGKPHVTQQIASQARIRGAGDRSRRNPPLSNFMLKIFREKLVVSKKTILLFCWVRSVM